MLGYDGPVKVWLDGKEIHHDPDGTNPANVDSVKIPIIMKKGDHEVLAALGSNHGKAWGIFLRYQRTGLPWEVLEQGRRFYKIPQPIES